MMDRWIKLVGVFLLLFTVYDVSMPETCLDEGWPIAASSTQVQASHQDDNRPWEEHFALVQWDESCVSGLPSFPYSSRSGAA